MEKRENARFSLTGIVLIAIMIAAFVNAAIEFMITIWQGCM